MSPPDSSGSKSQRGSRGRPQPELGSPAPITAEAAGSRPPPLNVFDALGPNAKLTVTPPAQLAHDMELENQKEQHRERIEVILLYATLGFTGALAIAFTIVLFLNPKNPDLQKYAMTGILSILTAWIGFAAGKASTKSGG